MSANATIAASEAILKRRYKDGVPKLQYTKFPAMALIANKTDFVGDDLQIAVQNENPQGLGTTIGGAQNALWMSSYQRFRINRKSVYGVCRISGEALRAATMRGGGALVDLWTREMDCVSDEVLKDHEVSFFGNGSGALGQIASGQATATVTLTKPSDVAKFSLNMLVQVVSDTSAAPTIRGGTATARITAVNRTAGTLTLAAAWSATFTGIAANDWIVRAGNAADGTYKIPAGVKQWIVGGSTPGTWAGLNRNSDPTRLAGQVYDATGVPLQDALIEMESLLSVQGAAGPGLVLMHNPRDNAKLKQALGGKVVYDRADLQSRIAGISFKSMQFEGDNGTVAIVSNPFVSEGESILVDPKSFALYSAGPAPMILDFDSNNFLRVSNEDAYEVRYGTYGEWGCDNPLANIRATGWGV